MRKLQATLTALFALGLLAGCNEQTAPPLPTPLVVSSTPAGVSLSLAPSPEVSATPAASATPESWSYPDREVVVRTANDVAGSTALTARNGDRVIELIQTEPDGFYLRVLKMEVGPGYENGIQFTNLNPGLDEAGSLESGGIFVGTGGPFTEPYEMVMEAYIEGRFEEFQPSEKDLETARAFLSKTRAIKN